MLKVDRLVVVHDAALARGGATALAIASALEARKRGLIVTFITGAGEVSADLLTAGIHIVQVPGERIAAGNRLKGMTDGLYRKATLDVITGWIRANDTPSTAYHLHNWTHFLSPSVFVALRPVSERLVLSAHDFFLSCPNGAQFSYTENAVCTRKPNSMACLLHACDSRSYLDKIWRSVRHFVRQTAFDLDQYHPPVLLIHDALGPKLGLGGVPQADMQVLRNPIRPFSQARVPAEANSEILFVGRLSQEKGADLAAEAAKVAQMPIRFAGTGPMLEELKTQYPTAHFEGWCSHEQIADLIQKARVLVMPSRWAEPFGMVAVEALWSGVPVILSDSAFLADEIVAAGAGIACDVSNIAEFASALKKLQEDDELVKAMSVSAYEHTSSLALTMDAWGSDLAEIYSGLRGFAKDAPLVAKRASEVTIDFHP